MVASSSTAPMPLRYCDEGAPEIAEFMLPLRILLLLKRPPNLLLLVCFSSAGGVSIVLLLLLLLLPLLPLFPLLIELAEEGDSSTMIIPAGMARTDDIPYMLCVFAVLC